MSMMHEIFEHSHGGWVSLLKRNVRYQLNLATETKAANAISLSCA